MAVYAIITQQFVAKKEFIEMKAEYKKRVVDEILDFYLESMGAVLIEGPKWCGKTRTGEEHAKSVVKLQDPDNVDKYRAAIKAKPSILLEGPTPRLIDEWQDFPILWNAVRHLVDERGEDGQFILTGSAVPCEGKKDKIPPRHTGTGRIVRMRMRPMSLWESGESTGEISLSALFDGAGEVSGRSSIGVDEIAHLVCRGGWPQAVLAKTPRAAYMKSSSYVDEVVHEDVHRVDGVERNPDRVRNLLKSLARNISTMATNETILQDLKANDSSISEKTLSSYLNALRKIFLVEDVPAWSPSLRSRLAIRSAMKRQFVDPSVATAVLGATPRRLLNDFRSFGSFFESLCVRDVRVYAQTLDGEVRYYRDQTGLEADMIVALKDGRWGAIEVKLGAGDIDSAAEGLKKLRAKVDVGRMGHPSFLMILTGTDLGYTRDDGVVVCPLGCLRP